jgi:hypothetical protein
MSEWPDSRIATAKQREGKHNREALGEHNWLRVSIQVGVDAERLYLYKLAWPD